MDPQQANNHYLVTQVQTASPGELTLLLYNGCIRFVKQAKKSMEQGKAAEKHEFIIRARNIIEELQATLNMNYELSHNLYSLYDYMLNLLDQGNIKQNVENLDECLNLLVEIRDTWGEAVKQVKLTSKVTI